MKSIHTQLCTLIASFLLIPALQAADSARVRKLFPKEALFYLRKKEVPRNLQLKLDGLFADPKTQDSLAVLHRGHKRTNSLSQQEEKAREELESAGFNFASDDSSAVFSHKDLPNYMLKMSTLNKGGSSLKEAELFNAGRIKFADDLRQKINQQKLNVKVPYKMAYFTQFYKGPQLLVVAEKLSLNEAERSTDAQAQFVLKHLSYWDNNASNVLYDSKSKQILLFDTEPFDIDIWNESIFSCKQIDTEVWNKSVFSCKRGSLALMVACAALGYAINCMR